MAGCVAAVLAALATLAVGAEPYPSRPVRLFVPYSPGTGPDIIARTLATRLSARRNDDGEFSLGTRPLQWADAYVAQSDILRAFDANARRIEPLATETVMLAVLEGAEVLYLACRPGSRPLAVNFRVGGRFE